MNHAQSKSFQKKKICALKPFKMMVYATSKDEKKNVFAFYTIEKKSH